MTEFFWDISSLDSFLLPSTLAAVVRLPYTKVVKDKKNCVMRDTQVGCYGSSGIDSQFIMR